MFAFLILIFWYRFPRTAENFPFRRTGRERKGNGIINESECLFSRSSHVSETWKWRNYKKSFSIVNILCFSAKRLVNCWYLHSILCAFDAFASAFLANKGNLAVLINSSRCFLLVHNRGRHKRKQTRTWRCVIKGLWGWFAAICSGDFKDTSLSLRKNKALTKLKANFYSRKRIPSNVADCVCPRVAEGYQSSLYDFAREFRYTPISPVVDPGQACHPSVQPTEPHKLSLGCSRKVIKHSSITSLNAIHSWHGFNNRANEKLLQLNRRLGFRPPNPLITGVTRDRGSVTHQWLPRSPASPVESPFCYLNHEPNRRNVMRVSSGDQFSSPQKADTISTREWRQARPTGFARLRELRNLVPVINGKVNWAAHQLECEAQAHRRDPSINGFSSLFLELHTKLKLNFSVDFFWANMELRQDKKSSNKHQS